ncbi:MAG: family 10 glycosylhydrolase [Sumerlaeia bacterium]
MLSRSIVHVKAVALALALSLVQAVSAQEMRVASILVYDDINDTAAIQNWVDEIDGLGFNAVAVHARFRGDATYFPNKTNSQYPNDEPRSSAAGGIDVLQEFITRGHAKGLKVFAYVNVWLQTDGSDTDPRANHPVNTHPEWITYHYNGGNPARMTTAQDDEGIWFDPGIPAARTYMANVCGDIMKNYNADGIIIDRIRYPQTYWRRADLDFGYHPTAISRFNSQYGKSGVPSPSDSQWQQFRRDQVTESVRAIYNTITAIDPNHMLLSFPIGRVSDAINFNYQDWPAWLNAGVCDGAIVQIYRDTNSDFSAGCDEHLAAYSGNRLLGVATKCWISSVDVDGQIAITRQKGFDGTSPFRHGVMEGLGLFPQLSVAYSTPASWPAMPWKVPTTFIVDNNTAGWSASGNWWASSSTPGYYGSNYRVRSTASTSDAATWKVNLPVGGNYEVFARWASGSNRASSAPYIVYHKNGSTTKNMNQRTNGGQWVSLGTYNFNAGNATRVALSCWTSSGQYVIGDAIKMEKR